MNYKAVIFDLDGTLLDTLEDLADSMNAVLERNSYPTYPVDAYKYLVGNGMRTLVRRAFPDDMQEDENIDRGVSAMRDEYSRRWKNKTKPYAGIAEMLNSLVNRGLKIAVLSNKSDDFTKLIIKNLLPEWNFDLVFGERPGISIKPNPAGALEIARTLEISPAEFLYLGDTGVDMKTAVSAGMYAVGVLWGFREAEELAECGAKLLIDHPSSILDLL